MLNIEVNAINTADLALNFIEINCEPFTLKQSSFYMEKINVIICNLSRHFFCLNGLGNMDMKLMIIYLVITVYHRGCFFLTLRAIKISWNYEI